MKYIRSFKQRHRKLTKRQEYALHHYWFDIGIEFKKETLDFIQIFGCNNAPLILEVGFGMGESLINMAKIHPQKKFIGIEVYKPGIGACLALAKQEKIKNLRIIFHDAVQVLEQMIPNNSLDKVQIFFPDTWHKTRHNKRRIVQKSFVTLIMHKLRLGGILHIATDWQNYAEYILNVMHDIHGYTNLSVNNDYIERPLRPLTKFEQRAQKLGHNIWDMMFIKNNTN